MDIADIEAALDEDTAWVEGNISGTPFGELTMRHELHWSAFLVNANHGARTLTRTHISGRDHSQTFLAAVETLTSKTQLGTIAFMVHLVRGDISFDEFQVQAEHHITIRELPLIMGRIEDDVLYIVNKERSNAPFSNEDHQ